MRMLKRGWSLKSKWYFLSFQIRMFTIKIFVAQHCLGPWSFDKHTQEASCVIQVGNIIYHTSKAFSLVYYILCTLSTANLFRVTVCSMNSQKQPIYRECSGIKWAPYLLKECVTLNDLSPSTGKLAWARMRWWPCWTWTPCSPSSPSSSPSTSVSPHPWSPPRCQPTQIRSKFECPPSCRSVARWSRIMQWWTT